MGCDIHLYVEKRHGSQWERAEQMIVNDLGHLSGEPVMRFGRWYDGRNYDLFAILADVRNGHGFAGVDTGDRLVPIASPRGIPADCSPSVKKSYDEWDSDGHSHSWFTLRELLDYDWTQVAVKRGTVTAVIYEEWKRLKAWEPCPKEYSGGVSGGNVMHVTEEEMNYLINAIAKDVDRRDLSAAIATRMANVYTRIQWTEPYSERVGSWWTQTMPRLLAAAKGDYDSVRIVFWFDN